ncbi:MAG: DUF1990 domain-containing protein [Acidobacteria bacterium]|nr:DUF1990 domain-containing protein [Acidobacteriota bacterium]
MFCISKPDRAFIDEFLSSAVEQQFSYPDVGATKGDPPMGYSDSDHNRIVIGKGFEDWEKAKQAVREWKMFDLGWCGICWPDTPIEADRNVAMIANHMGFYSLNGARIVYIFDEPDKFGFAYGTLTDHVEFGEERFAVERDLNTGEVFYDLYSFSRPRHILAQLGYPYARYLQKSFVADSKAAMRRAVRSAN